VKGPDDTASAVVRTARRYRGCGRFAHGYVGAKLRRDPLYAMLPGLAEEHHFGSVLDIGCGRGQLGILLLEAGVAASVRGIDWNRRHLLQAQRAAGDLPFCTDARDLSQCQVFPVADTVFVVDVCYQLQTAAQANLLRAAARAARERILVRTADPARGLRSVLTRGLERLGRAAWPHAGAYVNQRPLAETVATLTEGGFAVTWTPCWRGTPFANVLVVGRRAGAADAG
jgi:SAM-dependent methyltransferase